MKTKEHGPGSREFIALMAVIMAIAALSVDMMLPAFPDISKDLNTSHPNDVQLIVTVLFIGMGVGQFFFGPLSDCFGRKPVVFWGFLIFTAGCLLCIFSNRLDLMLAGRFIQGLGASGPRTAIIALIRDRFGGRAMAQIMSAIMAVFILVPVIAPALGQLVLLWAGWHMIFLVLMILGLLVLVWFYLRQPETLAPENRLPFSMIRLLQGLKEVCTNRQAMGYTLAASLISGAILAYLSCAQPIFQDIYELDGRFTIYMAFLALSLGCASLINSRIVMRFGMRLLSYRALLSFIFLMVFFLGATLRLEDYSPLWLFTTCFALSFFCLGIIFGNLNAIAMEPLGHIAGVAAAVIGALTHLISSSIAIAVGRYYNGTTIPLTAGFILIGILAFAVMLWADR